jgi:PAS domain S-box-containing protein
MDDGGKTREELLLEVEDLRRQLAAAQAALGTGEELKPGPSHAGVKKQARVKTPAGTPDESQTEDICSRQATEERYRSLVELSPDAIVVEAQGQILFVNQAAIKLFGGLSSQDLVGQALLDLIHPDFRDAVRDRLRKIHSCNRVGPLEEQVLRLDGEAVPVEGISSSIMYQGRPAVQLIFRDITERKQAREALRAANTKLQALIEASPLAIVQLDREGIIQGVNPATERIFGWRSHELLGCPLPIGNEYKQDEAQKLIQQAFQGKLVTGKEIQAQRKDGAWIDVSISVAPMYDEKGEVCGIVGLAEDITARKQAETALAKSRAEFETIFNSISDTIIFANPERRIVLANPAVKTMFGYTPAELLGQSAEILYADKADYEAMGRKYYHLGPARTSHAYEIPYRRKNGTIFQGETVASQVRDAQGHILGFIGIHRDVTGRKLAEAALDESQRQLTMLANFLEHSSQPFAVGFLDGRLGMFNEAFMHLLGYSQRELSRLNWLKDLTPPEWWEGEAAKLEELRRTDQPVRYEKEYRRKDGTRVPVEIFVHLRRDETGQPSIYYAFITDITARKEAEEALLQERDFVTALLETLGALVVVLDREGRIVLFNKACEQTTGYSFEEVQEKSLFDLFLAPEEQVSITQVFYDLKSGKFPSTQINQWLTKDGDRRLISWSNSTLKDEQGEVAYIIGTGIDVTERQKAEEALQESEARFRAIFEGAAIGIALTDTKGRILTINSAFARSLGYSLSELGGKTFADLTPADDLQMTVDRFEELVAGRRDHYRLEKRYICKDGSIMWGSLAVSLIRDTSGVPKFAVGMIEDITGRKQAEAALQESEARFRAIFEGAPISIALIDSKGQILRTNPAVHELLGYEQFELEGRNFADITNPDDVQKDQDRYREIVTGKVSRYDQETRLVCKDGKQVWGHLAVSLIRDATGKPKFTIGMVEDITARKEAEAALERERQRLFALLDELPGFIFLHDKNYSVRFANRRCKEIFGDPQAQLCYLAFHQRETPCDGCPAPQVLASQTSVEWEQTIPDGRTFQIYKYPFRDVDGTPCILSLGLDITSRKQAELALRKQAELLDLAHDAIIVRDLNSRVTFWSRGAEETYGWTREQAQGQISHVLLQTKFPVSEATVEREVLQQGKWFGELLPTRADGKVIVVASRWALQRDDAGRPVAILEIDRDITERQQAELALRESEEKFRQLAENIDDVFWLGSGDWRQTHYISPAYERVWGRSCASLYEEPSAWFEGVAPDDRSKVRLALKSRADGDFFTAPFPEYRIMRPDGTVRWISARFFPIRDEAGNLIRIAGIATDITARKEMEAVLRWREEHLRQTAKMEAVGQLAGGVAHDFNNLLTVISGYGELLLADLKETDPSRQQVQAILKAAEQASAVTRQLLAFSRKEMLQPQILELNGIISGLVEMFSRLIDENIVINLKLEPELGAVKADPGHIEQVVMNLALNALDAMPEGGTLGIETANVQVAASDARRHPEITPGSYVVVTVQDTGIGMKREVLSRIFEPFFTTKERGKGTGLGLSMAYGIIRQSGGHILVESTPGRGSRFRIYLPCVGKGQETALSTPAHIEAQGTATILLVEDEIDVRQVVHRMLALKGYMVLTASDGQAALKIGQTHPGPIHLLLTDVAMPGMGGRDLAVQLASAHPEMKVLFMSGHTEDGVVRRGAQESALNFIQKPFRTEQLLQKVRELLAKSRG